MTTLDRPSDRLTRMIAAQQRLQRDLGFDVESMTQVERIAYIHSNVTNVVSEVMEALGEVDWKPWTTGHNIREDACFGELRDAWQCLTNAMLAVKVGSSPADVAEELEHALEQKHIVNRRRHAEGYDGYSSKCPHCRRALDDAAVRCTPDLGYCDQLDPTRSPVTQDPPRPRA